MKIKLFLLAVMVLAGGLFTGCATMSDTESIAKKLEQAAFLGSSLHLRDNPEDRPKVEEVRSQLAIISSQTNTTTSDIVGIIQSIPLKGDAVYYREIALLLLDELQTPELPTTPQGVQLLVAALDRGLARGLSTVQAAKEVKEKAVRNRSRTPSAQPAPAVK